MDPVDLDLVYSVMDPLYSELDPVYSELDPTIVKEISHEEYMLGVPEVRFLGAALLYKHVYPTFSQSLTLSLTFFFYFTYNNIGIRDQIRNTS